MKLSSSNSFAAIITMLSLIGFNASANEDDYSQKIRSLRCDQNHFGRLVNDMKISVDGANNTQITIKETFIGYENQITQALGERLRIDPIAIRSITLQFQNGDCYQSKVDAAVLVCRSNFSPKQSQSESEIQVTTGEGKTLTTRMVVEFAIDQIITERALFGPSRTQQVRFMLGEESQDGHGTAVLGVEHEDLGLTQCQ